MTPVYIVKLGLVTKTTNVGTQKIDSLSLKTYSIATAGFLFQDRQGRTRFFQETFWLADTSMEVVLRMFLPFFSNANIQVDDGKLTWKSYTIAEALPTTRQMELIDNKKFVKAVLDDNSKTFVVHVAALKLRK